jgi:hypothetical protein
MHFTLSTLSRSLILASLTLCLRLSAEDIVVFANGDFVSTGGAAPSQSAGSGRAAFLEAAQRDFSGHAPFDVAYPLINPPAWGRVVNADTSGKLQIRRSFGHGLVFHLDMEHLQADHTYVLCINGRPQHPGNELLPESVPGHAEEKYYDFYTVTTDSMGSYHAGFALLLRPGAYNVHFYVKDTTDHKIVLYGLEYFDFTAR